MNPFSAIKHLFVGVKDILEKAFKAAKDSGLTDAVIHQALPFIHQASEKFVDNTARREWVVSELMAIGVPEGVARIATQLAYNLYKSEMVKLDASAVK